MRTPLIVGLLFVILGVCGGAYWYFGGFQREDGRKLAFIDAYGRYTEESDRFAQHVFAASEGEERRALFSALSELLTGELAAEDRLAVSGDALGALAAIEQAVETAARQNERVRGSIDDLERAGLSFSAYNTRARAEEVVNLTIAHHELSGRVLEGLAGSNGQMRDIFARIEADRGELTAGHIEKINEQTTDAEVRFDLLTRHFGELAALAQRRDAAYQTFVEGAF